MSSKTCVIGLGVVGRPTAQSIYEHGFQVYGYDISPKKIKNVFTTTNWDDLPRDMGTYVIAVSTKLNNRSPDLTSLYDVCAKISESNHKALVCMESTVPVGTCRKLAEEFNLTNFVHVPHRYWSKEPEKHGVKQLRVFGALNKQSLTKGLKFYGKLEIPLYVVPKIETAEMSKIAENAYRFVEIAFAEELKLICDNLGLDFDQVRNACNTKWNIKLLEAREGIEGECLPKDIRYLLSHRPSSPLLIGAIQADSNYKQKITKRKGQKDRRC